MQWIVLTALLSTVLLIENAEASTYLQMLLRMKRHGGGGDNGSPITQSPSLPPYPTQNFTCRIENKDEIIRALNDLLYCLGYKVVPLDAVCFSAVTRTPVVETTTYCPPVEGATQAPIAVVETTTYCPPEQTKAAPETWAPPMNTQGPIWGPPITEGPKTEGPIIWGPPITDGPQPEFTRDHGGFQPQQ